MVDPHASSDRVFVYGTLRRGLADNPTARAFRDGASFLCDGWLRGRLYAVGWYPALVDAADGHSEVRGEVWDLIAPGLMRRLDEYEGLFDGPPLYTRLRRTIRTDHGPIRAWAYHYARTVDGLPRIATGDWADAVTSP